MISIALNNNPLSIHFADRQEGWSDGGGPPQELNAQSGPNSSIIKDVPPCPSSRSPTL